MWGFFTVDARWCLLMTSNVCQPLFFHPVDTEEGSILRAASLFTFPNDANDSKTKSGKKKILFSFLFSSFPLFLFSSFAFTHFLEDEGIQQIQQIQQCSLLFQDFQDVQVYFFLTEEEKGKEMK